MWSLAPAEPVDESELAVVERHDAISRFSTDSHTAADLRTAAEMRPSFHCWANGPRGRAQPDQPTVGARLGAKRRTPWTTNAVFHSGSDLKARLGRV